MNSLAALYSHVDTGMLLENGNTYQPASQASFSTSSFPLFVSFALHNQNRQRIAYLSMYTTRRYELWYNYNNDGVFSFLDGMGGVFPTGLAVQNGEVCSLVGNGYRALNEQGVEYQGTNFFLNTPDNVIDIPNQGVFAGGSAATVFGDSATANAGSITLLAGGFPNETKVSDTNFLKKLLRYTHNNGRGINFTQTLFKSYKWILWNFTHRNLIGNQYGDSHFPHSTYGLARYAAPAFPQEYKVVNDADRAKYFSFRQLNKVTKRPYERSRLLKDYVFENSNPNLQLYSDLTGALVRTDSASQQLPNTWQGVVSINLFGNKWGGQVADEVTQSVLKNVTATNFYAYSQSPAGWDELHLELGGNVGTYRFDSARKRKVILTTTGQAYTVNTLQLNNNDLTQTLAELIDFNIVKPSICRIDNNPRLSGIMQRPPDNMWYLQASNLGSVEVPVDFNNVEQLYLSSTIVKGKVVANKATRVQVSSTGTASDFDIDLSGNTVLAELWGHNNTGKLKKVVLPVSGDVNIVFQLQQNGLIPFIVIDESLLFTCSIFYMYSTYGQGRAFPVCKQIRSASIYLYDMELSTEHINGTIDNFIDYQHQYGRPKTENHTLYLHSNPGYVTDTAERPTRRSDMLYAIEQNNWFVRVNVDSTPDRWILSIKDIMAGDSVNRIVVEVYIANLNQPVGSNVVIDGNNYYSGTWTVISRGVTRDAALEYPNSAGNASSFYHLENTGVVYDAAQPKTGTIYRQ